MEKSSKENLTHDIENRLDDFFDENETEDTTEVQTPSLEKLKSIVLSIDWEITETCLTDLMDETDGLLPRYQSDRFSHALLRMLKAVSGYIRKRKAQAHPDAIKLIMSAFSSIEQLTGESNLDEEGRKHIVAKEIAGFKKLKEQVEGQREAQGQHANPVSVHEQGFVECKQFEQAMSEVETRLGSQVEDLKAQLEILQKELDQIRSS